nr:IQ motif, EF-hand binding site [Tanacetum cinerariifolium]
MTLAENVSGSLQSTIPDDNDFVTNRPGTNISEEEQYLKDALASYRRTAHVATCIHAAFGEQSFKLKSSNGEEDEKQENIDDERFFQASIKQAEERAERSVIQYSCKVAMILVFGEKLEADEIGGLKHLYHCIEKGYNSMPLDLPRTPFKKVIKSMNELSRLGMRNFSSAFELWHYYTVLSAGCLLTTHLLPKANYYLAKYMLSLIGDDERSIPWKLGGINGGNKHFKSVLVKQKTQYRLKAKQSTTRTAYHAGTNKASNKESQSNKGNRSFSISNSFKVLNVDSPIIKEVATGSKVPTSGNKHFKSVSMKQKTQYQPKAKQSTTRIAYHVGTNNASNKESQMNKGQCSVPLIERINVIEKQILKGKLVLVDDDGKPLDKGDEIIDAATFACTLRYKMVNDAIWSSGLKTSLGIDLRPHASLDIWPYTISHYNRCYDSLEIKTFKHTPSDHLKEKESLEQKITLLKNDFQKEESRNIDRELALEKQRNTLFSLESALTFVELFEINDLKAQAQAKDTVILKLREKLHSLSVDVNENLQAATSIKSSRVRSKEQCDDLINKVNLKSAEVSDLNASLQEKVLVITALKETISNLKGKKVVIEVVSLNPIDPELLKIDVAPLAPQLRKNRTAHTDYTRHTQEEATTLREIIESERLLNPLNTSLDYAYSGCSKHMTGDRSQLVNFVQKFLGTIKFGNDHVAKIMGYEDYQIGNVTISWVYYVEGLAHNLFSVGQFCDSDLEVAFLQHTCFIRNFDGVDLLTGS